VTATEAARRRGGLEMRARCESCGVHLDGTDAAFICSYECTFCAGCASSFDHTCPNCAGELVPRPKRAATGAACEVKPA
jgi:hypothetical protein